MVSFREVLQVKRFICCTLTISYSIYITAGLSIASIYMTSARYISAPYCTIYITYQYMHTLQDCAYVTLEITVFSLEVRIMNYLTGSGREGCTLISNSNLWRLTSRLDNLNKVGIYFLHSTYVPCINQYLETMTDA